MSILRSRTLGLAAFLALVAVVIGFPTVLLAIDAVPMPSDLAWSRLTAPDDGTLAITVVGVVAWLAWAVFTASVGIELVARTRGIRPPHLPGLSIPQVTAGRLVALASLLFVAVPVAAQTVAPRAAASAPETTELPPLPQMDAQAPSAQPPGRPGVPTTDADVESFMPYTVKRGDSLWKIAENKLGDGRRYVELVALNETVLNGRPDFIAPGTVLRVPVDQGSPSDERGTEYLVQSGDTLYAIAEHELGEARLYPRIYEASRAVEQVDGRHLDDPDLILPGWRLTIPQAEEPRSDHPLPPVDEPPPRQPQEPPVVFEPPERRYEATGPDRTSQPVVDETADLDDEEPSPPDWALPGLTGAGAVLAGALLLVLRQHRRTQMRYRRPGMVVAPPPPELRPVEKTAHLAGSVTAPAVFALDRALRDLAATCASPPSVLVVRLGTSRIGVQLAQPSDLPAPWTGNGCAWSIETSGDVAEEPDQLAPYPLLVSVGQADDSDLVLLNLEELRSVTLAGASGTAAGLGRHIAAELALNPWSSLVEIDTLGIGAELGSIDPIRMRHHARRDPSFLERLAAAIKSEALSGDPDRYRALLAAGEHDGELLRRISRIITHSPNRSGAAIVTIDTEPGPDDVTFRMTPEGRLVVVELDLDLIPAGLNADEAAACAAIVDITRNIDSLAAPLTLTAADGQDASVDGAWTTGSKAIEQRPVGPAGQDSLLPLATAEYVEAAATTTEDVERLAPAVPKSARDIVRAADATLDEDLALWFDADALIPRLTLLGPVDARAYGNPRAVSKRKPFYIELLAYLALHPEGVTSHEVADAFGLTVPRVRTDIGVLRSWLGTDHRSGEPHLPSANAATVKGSGLQRYQVQGVLMDLDLFRRLRTRAQANGSEGIDDLKCALDLVAGEPFSHLRPAGWSWLLDGDRLDHIMSCAVADVGHILTTHALTVGDLELARWSAEKTIGAAPYDDVCRLDLIKVAAESGHADLAQRQLVDEVLNRSDDGLGPVELPGRSADILSRSRWIRDRDPR